MAEQTEIWWFELRLWPFGWFRVEAEVYIEQRPHRPGMKTYQCAGNDLAWWFWRLYDRLMTLVMSKRKTPAHVCHNVPNQVVEQPTSEAGS